MYISDVVPAPLNAGFMLMHRHLSRLAQRYELFVFTEDNPKVRHLEFPFQGIKIPEHSKNICRRILSKIGLDPIWVLFMAGRICRQIDHHINEHKPHVIISVWQSAFLLAAYRSAKKRNIPFIIIIHDDWEEMINRRQWTKLVLKKILKKIFHGANFRICISTTTSTQFQKKYGSAQCDVMPPIPSDHCWKPKRGNDFCPLRIATFGELMGNIEVIKAVSEVLVKAGSTLTFFSHAQNATRNSLACTDCVIDGGSLFADQMTRHLAANFDVILIPQSFEADHKTLVQSCFPSKIPEASRIGLPIITIGPKYGTAYEWAKNNMPSELVLGSLDSAIILDAIVSLKRYEFWVQAQGAVWQTQSQFDPEKVQNKFENILNLAAKNKDKHS